MAEYKSEYELPAVKASPLSPKILKFFHDRGIKDSTIEYFGVTEGVEYMPQVQKDRPVIQFNYIRKGRRINIKFRDSEKNFKLNKGSEMIMYGLDLIKDASWCIITEGEFDAMAFYEAGLQQNKLMFACSVPNGASTGNQNLTYLDNSIDEFENKDKIYLALDNDAPGIKLRNELSRRIGKDRIWLVNFPDDCKDANDVLLKHGSEELVRCIDSAKPYPLEGVSKASDSRKEIHNLYDYGMPQGETIGYNNFDGLMSWNDSSANAPPGGPSPATRCHF